ncbi:hypothetical protein KAR91_46240 [Candidatus Pacearchaeota archaeon]|nr:hypothetical protein [Candidatus Pacearchaeota archaeon]
MKTGDRVVCVRTSEYAYENGAIKGNICIILAMKKWPCGCISVQVSTVRRLERSYCCDRSYVIDDGISWIDSSFFAPIVTKSEFISSDEFQDIEETIDLPITIES